MFLPGSGYPLSFGIDIGDHYDIVYPEGFKYGSGPFSECNFLNFFGQTKDVILSHAAGIVNTGTKVQTDPQEQDMLSTIQGAVRHFKTVFCKSDGTPDESKGSVISDVINPVFTPGGSKEIERGTGGYSEFVGTKPSEFAFSIQGVRPWDLFNMSRYMLQIQPMSYGVYLVNQEGDVLGVEVLLLSDSSGNPYDPGNQFVAMFLPIPLLALSRQATGLGGLEEPDVTRLVATLPPNWESPYPEYHVFGIQSGASPHMVRFSTLCAIPYATLKNL